MNNLARPINTKGKDAIITSPYSASHLGVDYAYPNGTPVYAMADGKVTIVRNWTSDSWIASGRPLNTDDYGNYIKIDIGEGYSTLSAHLQFNSMTVKAGDTVKKGQQIGLVGSTGNSTGNHLHQEVRLNEKSIDFSNLVDYSFIAYPVSTNPTPPSNSTNTSPAEAKWTTYTSALIAHKDDVDVNYYTDDPKRIVDDVIKYKNSNRVLTGNNEQLAKNIDALVKAHQKELTDKETEFERNLSNLDKELLKETQRADEAVKALKEHVCPTWYSGLLQAVEDVKSYLEKHKK